MRTKAGLIAVMLVTAISLVGCGQDAQPEPVGDAIRLSPSLPSASGSAASGPAASGPAASGPSGSAPSPASVIDRTADIDVDDQVGDGRSVQIDSVRTGRAGARLVIIDASTGKVVGSDVLRPGVQLVTVRLDTPLEASGELLARLVVDNETGTVDIVIDDEGEAVEEDFDYELR